MAVGQLIGPGRGCSREGLEAAEIRREVEEGGEEGDWCMSEDRRSAPAAPPWEEPSVSTLAAPSPS